MFLLDRAFGYIVKSGALAVTGPDHVKRIYGDGSEPKIHLKIHDKKAALNIALDPGLHFGESYMEGAMSVEQGTIYDALDVLLYNIGTGDPLPFERVLRRLRYLVRRLHQYNPIKKAQTNVAHHYDLSAQLYDLFLDSDRQYSCAYFANSDMSLDEAQSAKKRHLAAKLQINPGMRILDIGSGWGGLAFYLAEVCGAQVTGITLSQEQHKFSVQRAQDLGLSDRVSFLLQDYRALTQPFDRIVSVGMFEHVGIGHYREFFAKIKALLVKDGIGVLHSINRSDGPGVTNAWIHKYIFPGGYAPSLSEVLPFLENLGLYVTDIEILRLHYAKTLQEWRRLFAANRSQAAALYDERFCRMWEFYLAASELSFRYSGMNNFQIQFCCHQNALPITRNYMLEEEKRLGEPQSQGDKERLGEPQSQGDKERLEGLTV